MEIYAAPPEGLPCPPIPGILKTGSQPGVNALFTVERLMKESLHSFIHSIADSFMSRRERVSFVFHLPAIGACEAPVVVVN